MIRLPKIKGIIERRILINYKIDIEVLKEYLPKPFEPVEVNGYGMGGICLIRLKNIRPIGIPSVFGINSENGAHRIAVKWKENNRYVEGVYIPRRDTSSKINSLVGGKIFPGEHCLSDFEIDEKEGKYQIGFRNEDGTYLEIKALDSDQFSKESIFENIESASIFFEKGAIGYSPNGSNSYDCLELKTYNWEVKPLRVISVDSSYFGDRRIFPKDSVIFDNALVMKNIEHEWNMKESIKK